jgi:hypothetical protein
MTLSRHYKFGSGFRQTTEPQAFLAKRRALPFNVFWEMDLQKSEKPGAGGGCARL